MADIHNPNLIADDVYRAQFTTLQVAHQSVFVQATQTVLWLVLLATGEQEHCEVGG